MKLSAKYEIKLPGHFLLMLANEKDDSVTFKTTHNDFCVEISLILDKSDGVRAQDENYITHVSKLARLVVSREQEEALPPIEDRKKYGDYFCDRSDTYTEIAIIVINRLIDFFKYKLGNPGLYNITPYNQTDFDNPVWEDCNGNELDPKFSISAGSRAFGIPYYSRFDIQSYNSDIHSTELQKALKIEYTPELYEEILADAKTAIAQDNYRRAVLEMAIACEIYVKQFFFRSSEISATVFEYLEEKRKIEVSVIDLLHNVSRYAFGNSFKDTNPEDYRNIDYLFRARNKIAHQGQPCYKDEKGIKQNIYDCVLEDWWSSIKSVISWLAQRIR